MDTSNHIKQLNARISADLHQALSVECARRAISIQAAIIDAVEDWLKLPPRTETDRELKALLRFWDDPKDEYDQKLKELLRMRLNRDYY